MNTEHLPSDIMGRAEYIHDKADAEIMSVQTATQAEQDARTALQESKAEKDRTLQIYGHVPVVDDTKSDIAEAPALGSLAAPNPAHIKKSDLNKMDATIATRKTKLARRTEAKDKLAKRAAAWTRACVNVDEACQKVGPSSLTSFISQHEFDDPSIDAIKQHFEGVTASDKVIEALGRTMTPITDEEIETLVGPAVTPLALMQPTHAQRANAVAGARPYLQWKPTAASNALTLGFGGVPADLAGGALAVAIWLGREQVIEELKRQAAVLAEKNGTLTPKEYRAKLAEAKAAKYLAELETAAAWWRCRDAGFDTLPPPVSGRALLLIAPE